MIPKLSIESIQDEKSAFNVFWDIHDDYESWDAIRKDREFYRYNKNFLSFQVLSCGELSLELLPWSREEKK